MLLVKAFIFEGCSCRVLVHKYPPISAVTLHARDYLVVNETWEMSFTARLPEPATLEQTLSS